VCNVDELGLGDNPYVDEVRRIAQSLGSEAVVICGKYEAELADIQDPNERQAFLADIGLAESGLSSLIHSAYRQLGLRTFSLQVPTNAVRGRSGQATKRLRPQV